LRTTSVSRSRTRPLFAASQTSGLRHVPRVAPGIGFAKSCQACPHPTSSWHSPARHRAREQIRRRAACSTPRVNSAAEPQSQGPLQRPLHARRQWPARQCRAGLARARRGSVHTWVVCAPDYSGRARAGARQAYDAHSGSICTILRLSISEHSYSPRPRQTPVEFEPSWPRPR
jgi:hypothetical protein